jgi:hypothetical protein
LAKGAKIILSVSHFALFAFLYGMASARPDLAIFAVRSTFLKDSKEYN